MNNEDVMIKNIVTVGLFSLVLNAQTFAQNVDCKLETSLTKKQISSLTKIENIKRIGLNKTILGDEVYKIKILNNKITNQLLVFLGETHIKGPRSSYLGKKLIKQFNVRIIEGVPSAEVQAMKKNNPELYSSIGWKRKVFQYLTFNPFESTIYDVSDYGENFGINELTQATKERGPNNEYTIKDLFLLQKVLSQSNESFYNIPMEFGDYLEPSGSDQYILEARNVRMAKNIEIITEATADRGPQLVVVGMAHIPGLVEILTTKNFEVCKLEL